MRFRFMVAFLTVMSLLCLGNDSYAYGDINGDLRILQNHPNSQQRIDAARRLGQEMGSPTDYDISDIAGVLRRDPNYEVQCAAAGVFAALGRRRWHHNAGGRTPREAAVILGELRQSLIYEDNPLVRRCILAAAAEFDSNEAQVILDLGKSDIDPSVRDMAWDAERWRNRRLQEEGQ